MRYLCVGLRQNGHQRADYIESGNVCVVAATFAVQLFSLGFEQDAGVTCNLCVYRGMAAAVTPTVTAILHGISSVIRADHPLCSSIICCAVATTMMLRAPSAGHMDATMNGELYNYTIVDVPLVCLRRSNSS